MTDGVIRVCLGTSGVSAGAENVAVGFEKLLKKHGLQEKYELIRVGDRGLFRDVLVDIRRPGEEMVTYEYVSAGDVESIFESHVLNGKVFEKLAAGADYEQFFSSQLRIVLSNCGEIDPERIEAYLEVGGYEAVKKALKMKPEEVISEVKESGLRGRGGAGFPTGLKWEFASKSKSDEKYLVCNADEGDPGALMDRSVLEGDPHGLLEGMIIGGYAIGATHGYVYCRAEYPLAVKRLNLAIVQARKNGFLGDNILGSGFSFDVIVKEGAGAFVCGEETALMASIEGFRGMPRPRPPFPAQSGLWGFPTNINNVESLANIRHIIVKGGKWFSSIGTENSKGTKVFALAGKIKNTGLVEVPMGMTLREVVDGPAGGLANKKQTFKAIQLGGPSGGVLPESQLDTRVDYEELQKSGAIMGSGGMIVMDQTTCMVDIARFFTEFCVAESCGKCVPCRVGLKRCLEVLERIVSGDASMQDLDFLEHMGDSIKKTALCGLGNTAPNPVLTTIRYFRNEYVSHIKDKKCPAKVCTPLLDFVVDEKTCIKCGKCVKVCPVDAIVWEKGSVATIDKKLCVECKSCIGACPVGAIE